MSKKKDEIKNDLFLLFKCLSGTFNCEYGENDLKYVINNLTSITNNDDLERLLKVFKEMPKSKITKYNLKFLIYKYDLLNEMFFEDGVLNVVKLDVLYPPYDKLVGISRIFANYCLKNDLKDCLTTEKFNAIYNLFAIHSLDNIHTLESYIIGNDDIPIEDVAKSARLFFDLYKIYHKFFDNLKLNVLITTAFEIYNALIPENALSGTKEYLDYINYLDKISLSNLIWFLVNFTDNREHIFKLIINEDFLNSKIFLMIDKRKVLKHMLSSGYINLLLKSPNLALKFYLHEKETGQIPYFNILNDIPDNVCREINQVV